MGILRTNEISGLETPTPVTGSVSFDGIDDALIIADHGDTFDFLNSNFTVECWIYPRGGGSSNFGGIWSKGLSYQLWWKEDTERIEVFASSDGSTYNILNAVNSGNGSVPANQWSHIAHTREGNTFRIFVNGILTSSATSSSTIISNTNAARISDYDPNPGTYELDGEISNLRVLKGTALYTADFTPPTHALEVINDTIILCCNNPDSVTASAFAGIGTAYAITTAGNPTVATRDPSLTRDFTFGTQFEGVAKFDTQGYFVPPSGTTEQRGGGRGVFAGGNSSNTISYVTIATTGNSSDFGDLLASRSGLRGGSSATRGLFTHSSISPYINTIEYVTISSTGNAIDFGDMLGTSSSGATGSNSTRSVFWEGTVPSTGVQICYVTTASLGNASEFGDMFIGVRHIDTMNSPTRCIVAGGYEISSNTNIIQYITFATTGDAVEFGDVVGTTNGIRGNASTSSSTRGVYGGGANSPGNSAVNPIEYLTMSSLGNTQDFGDLSIAKRTEGGGTSNGIRGIFAGGYTPAPANFNTIEYITIASTGDAMDFGDLSSQTKDVGACSDSHGGLS